MDKKANSRHTYFIISSALGAIGFIAIGVGYTKIGGVFLGLAGIGVALFQ